MKVALLKTAAIGMYLYVCSCCQWLTRKSSQGELLDSVSLFMIVSQSLHAPTYYIGIVDELIW